MYKLSDSDRDRIMRLLSRLQGLEGNDIRTRETKRMAALMIRKLERKQKENEDDKNNKGDTHREWKACSQQEYQYSLPFRKDGGNEGAD